ncbi:MAG: GAF domain-containing protein, partial [Anaerolineales bacterium]|nr:GAF domain-containing protein [Anaerolineales bacterium]
MTENNVRKDFFERRFAKLGSRYIGKMLDLSLMLGASVVIVAVYYLAAVANLPTFRVILVTFQITFASLFVNLVGMPLYNRVITRKSSAKLAAQEKGQILLEDTEEEHKAWEEVNFYVGRISVGTFFMGMINALGSVLVVMILAGTEPIVLFHTFIAGTIASTGVAIQNMLFMDRALAPVRAALLPSQINWQTARLGLHLRTRLLAVFGAIVVIVFLVLGPLGYQKILDATVPGANPEAILQNMGVQLIGLGMAAIVISFLLAFTAERAIVQPLEDIINTMNKVESGDLTARTEVISSGELGQVSLRLNQVIRQIEGAQAILEQRIAERTRNLELAAEVGRTVSQVRALDVMLKDAAELIRKQFDLYYVQVYLTDPSQTNLILQSGTGAVGAELVGRGHRLPLDTASITGRAAIEKKSVVISNTAASPTFRPNPLLPDTRSEMAVPLLIGERVVGVLDMQSEHAGSLSTDILTAFEALAGQLAIAIQNANFLAETQQARTEVEAQARR